MMLSPCAGKARVDALIALYPHGRGHTLPPLQRDLRFWAGNTYVVVSERCIGLVQRMVLVTFIRDQ